MRAFIILKVVLIIYIFQYSLLSCIVQEKKLNKPYPKSSLIDDVNWDFPNAKRAAPGSDLWPVTWAADNNIYTSWGDGGGFGGTNKNGRVSLGFARIEGNPDDFKTINIWGGAETKNKPSFKGKCPGIISVNGVLYAWINMQNGNPPDHKLAWSDDIGTTWNILDWAFSKEGTFFPSTFLQFGKDYSGARDDYVYIYGAKWVFTQGPENNIYLARVKKESIKDKNAYEFFKGVNSKGNSMWTPDIQERKPVFNDPNGVGNTGLAQVVFNPGINRYLLTVGHRSPNPNALDSQAKRLGIFDSPEPWGPWTAVVYYDDWKGAGDGPALGYSFPTKWISQDGQEMWMIYSSTDELDSFNLIKANLLLSN